MVKLVIFDLDGTLVNAYRAIGVSLNFTRKKFGYPSVRPQVVRRSVGWGDKNFIKAFFRGAQAARALEIYRRHHKSSLLEYSKVIPGAKKVLRILLNKGILLAIVSNRPAKFTAILLEHLALARYFDRVYCGKNKKDLKPSPRLLLKAVSKADLERAQAIYVGDMVIDVQAGKNAGLKTIAVLGGSSSVKELRQARPFRVISSLEGLLKII